MVMELSANVWEYTGGMTIFIWKVGEDVTHKSVFELGLRCESQKLPQ